MRRPFFGGPSVGLGALINPDSDERANFFLDYGPYLENMQRQQSQQGNQSSGGSSGFWTLERLSRIGIAVLVPVGMLALTGGILFIKGILVNLF